MKKDKKSVLERFIPMYKEASGLSDKARIASPCLVGGVYAVKKISIQVYEGQIVSITGANGAGKSSTLNALTGIYAPLSGNQLSQKYH